MVGERSFHNEVILRLHNINYEKKVIGTVPFDSSVYPIFHVIAGDKSKPSVFLSGGVHGDEPAGTYSVLKFLEEHVQKYLDKFCFYIYPCINPSGFEINKTINKNKVNINRDFSDAPKSQEAKLIQESLRTGPKEYVFAWDMHEDGPMSKEDMETLGEGFDGEPTPTEFYMWEICSDKSRRIGDKIIKAVEEANIPVCKWERIYKDKNSGGVIWYPEGCSNPTYLKGITFDQYLARNYSSQVFTAETHNQWDLEKRIKAHLKALLTALDCKK